MSATDPDPPTAPRGKPASPRRGLSRRGLLGGALTAALAAAVLPMRAPVAQRPNRWRGTTRWIGHA